MSDFNEGIPKTQKFFELGGKSRFGKWKVDTPPLGDTDRFLDILGRIIPTALNECDPRIRRANVNVRFVPKIIFHNGADQSIIRGGGNANYKKSLIGAGTIDITESIEAIKLAENYTPDTHWVITATGILLHELFEVDYDLKSEQLLHRAPRLSAGDPNYSEAEHEEIANARALACMRRVIGANYKVVNGCAFVLEH